MATKKKVNKRKSVNEPDEKKKIEKKAASKKNPKKKIAKKKEVKKTDTMTSKENMENNNLADEQNMDDVAMEETSGQTRADANEEQPVEDSAIIEKQRLEAQRLAEEARIAEEKRLEEERLAEEARIAEEKRLEEERKMEDERRAKEIHKKIKEIAAREAEESLREELNALKKQPETECCCNTCNEHESTGSLIKYVLICIAILAGAAIYTSYNNSNSYYLCESRKGIEIWKGDFTPLSKSKVIILEGIDLPGNVKKSYEQSELFPLPFNFFLDRADEEIMSGTPYDFDQIGEYIAKASQFALTREDAELIEAYKNSVNEAKHITNTLTIAIPSRRVGVE
ncbi:MAG: hypothetical protein HQK66_09505 [Desulfamplus sp.]|nr:hypothetical protein [Desulfamplus sp.]